MMMLYNRHWGHQQGEWLRGN